MEYPNKVIKITTKAIFERDGKALIVLNKNKKWELAGGQIQFGEDPEDALKRELKEELGFSNVAVGNIVNIFTFRTKFKTTNYQWVALVYKCSSKNNEDIKLSDEHADYKWCSLPEIKKLEMISSGYKKSIEKYLNGKL